MADARLHMNMEQVTHNIKADATLTGQQQRDLLSAVNTLAKWLEVPLDKIPADRKDIRQGFATVNASQLGVSKKRFANVRSLVDQALEFGMMGSFKKAAANISADWAALLELVPEGWQRFKMMQLARYCSEVNITPENVSVATFEAWRAWRVENAALAAKPGRIVDDAWTVWNRCAKEIETWPHAAIPKPGKSKAVLIPLGQLPLSLQEELKAFETASTTVKTGHGSALDAYLLEHLGQNDKASVTPKVAKNRVTAIRMCGTALVQSGKASVDELTSIKHVVSAEAAGLMAGQVVERRGQVTEYPHSLVKSLRAVAVQWLKVDQAEIEAFNLILKKLAKDADLGGLTIKNRARLAPFTNPQNVVRLISLPDFVMADLEQLRKKRGNVTIYMACKARTAIAIAILTMLPVRRANLAAIIVGKHLILPATKSDSSYLTFEPHEVKNTRSIGCTLPDEKRQLLALYLRYYHPVIVGKNAPNSPFLLSTRSGQAIEGSALNNDIRKLIEAETGLLVNTHLFRHFAAAIILRHRPGEMDTVRALLGHSKSSRITDLYAEIEAEVASNVLTEATIAETARRPKRRSVARKWER
ncbi:MAG: hypothetical protein ACPG1C_12360 [Alphaproteobacteria bacterium]